MQERSNKLIKYILLVYLYVIYPGLFLISPRFGPIDDHLLLHTIQSGRWFPLSMGIVPDIGRFFPLLAQEYNLVSLISKLPAAYFSFNLVQYIITVALIVYISKKIATEWYGYITCILLTVHPGFVSTWFRLMVPDRNSFFLFIILVACYVRLQHKQSVIVAIIGLICANIALYYKETGFIMLFVFALTHICLCWKKSNNFFKIYDGLLITSSLAYFSIYYFLIYINKGDTLYNYSTQNVIRHFINNIINYIMHDPVAVLLVIPLVIWRMFMVMTQKNENGSELADSLLIASFVYFMSFLLLNMFQNYYWLPGYSFAIPGLIYHFNNRFIPPRTITYYLLAFTLFFGITNSIPMAFHVYTYHKYVAFNYNTSLEYLCEFINRKSVDARVTIFLDGVNRGQQNEVYNSFITYLSFMGISSSKYDLKSDLQSDNSKLFKVDITSPFTLFRSNDISKTIENDLHIITPQTNLNVNYTHNTLTNSNIRLLYRTTSDLYIPNYNLISLVQYIISRTKTFFNLHTNTYKFDKSELDIKIITDPNYYVYEVIH